MTQKKQEACELFGSKRMKECTGEKIVLRVDNKAIQVKKGKNGIRIIQDHLGGRYAVLGMHQYMKDGDEEVKNGKIK